MIELNSFQTPLDKKLQKRLHPKVWSQLLEYIETVQFLQNLMAPEEVRGFAKDRPKDENGKVIVDLTKPHILEDLDFFRERALFFEKNGRYTNIPKNPNPKSEYGQFWTEELRRCKYGLVRPSDGEWIPGMLYWYWNYSVLWLVEKEVDAHGNVKEKQGKRRKTFPRPYLGDYLFYHYIQQADEAGMHGKMLKARGIGASFKFASMSPCNMYTKPGTGNPNFHLASENSFLKGDKGIWGKVLDNLDWIAEHTPWPKIRLVDAKRDMEIQLGYLDEYGVRKGLQSSVHGISLKDNPDKARGVRGPLIHYEEDGLFPNLEKAWAVNREATEEEGIRYGMMFAAGTGGVEGASFEGSEKLFYSPEAYNIYGIPNVFDKNTDGSTKCGFFWGAYLNKGSNYTLPNGDVDYVGALIRILEERHKIANAASDPRVLTQKKAELPIVPQEAIMRTDGTLFPIADLKDHLANILPIKDQFLSEHYVGDLAIDPAGEVVFKANMDAHALRKFPPGAGESVKGAVEIFEMPKKGRDGRPPRFRYIAGIDPYDDDHSTTSSLGSIFIFDVVTDRIVAEFTGRPMLANEFYETCYRLMKFYNATALYENDKKGLFTYFSNRNLTYMLADTPQILKDMEMVKPGNLYGNKSKGFNSGKMVNAWARRLQADWMLSPAYESRPENQPEIEEGEEPQEVPRHLNLHKIRSLAYIQEAIAWNIDGNFDRVSSMGAVMILREEYYKYILHMGDRELDQSPGLSEDPFFKVNYTGKTDEEFLKEQQEIIKKLNKTNNVLNI